MESQVQQLTGLACRRARNLFLTHQLLCSQAVLVTLNQGFGGGLEGDIAIRIASALPEGLGGSGCLCGAVGGGVLALGLFLGGSRPEGRVRRRVQAASKELHDLFRGKFGSTCCRILSKNSIADPKKHFNQCADLTGEAAGMTAGILLSGRPELVERAVWPYLERVDSAAGAALRRVAGFL
ncbi:MAG: C-GCAxxG-C-C family protein [Deltaproteobacteria bacterium]